MLLYCQCLACKYVLIRCTVFYLNFNPFGSARKDTTIPLLHPVLAADGVTLLTEIHIKAGTTVQVAMSESNLNTKTWGSDARTFRLERWLEPLPDTVTGASIPGIYSHLYVFIYGLLQVVHV